VKRATRQPASLLARALQRAPIDDLREVQQRSSDRRARNALEILDVTA
jgi:hypothetical protein